MRQKIRVLGVCGGNGVCLYPFKLNPNFKVIGNIEPRAIFHTKQEEQWRANFGSVPLTRTIEEIKTQKVDVIIGHPDCGDSSILRMSRSKSFGDARSNLSLNIFLDSINLFTPSYFLLENLPGLLNVLSMDELSERLNGEYTLSHTVSSVSTFGNSQVSRVRLVIVGERKKAGEAKDNKLTDQKLRVPHKDRVNKPFQPQPAEYFELGYQEIPEIGHIREPLSKLANLYLPSGERKISYLQAQKIWLELGSQAQRWPVGGVMKNQPGVTRNIVGKPPLTVRKQNRQFGSQGYVLSPREMANIQGVPSCFKIFINRDQIVYWLNKSRASVTKCAPYEIGCWFMNSIIKSNYKSHGNQKSKSKSKLQG